MKSFRKLLIMENCFQILSAKSYEDATCSPEHVTLHLLLLLLSVHSTPPACHRITFQSQGAVAGRVVGENLSAVVRLRPTHNCHLIYKHTQPANRLQSVWVSLQDEQLWCVSLQQSTQLVALWLYSYLKAGLLSVCQFAGRSSHCQYLWMSSGCTLKVLQ